MAVRARRRAHLLSCFFAAAQDVLVAPGTHVKSAALVRAFVRDGARYLAMIKATRRSWRAQDKSCQRRGRY
ncbi:hypothetical protein FIBSPDRAFT_857147 [Athelia psychrophila]|uniref:Secreted protein n=1 Tax=Athelia psychrophila TaxID=1759441 RepID=A0A166MYM4_9AGAM|nr:hypothetical protein FIBSPDRAFT_857147 [Fibularhizoctonia sp. CBS 109695]